MNIGHHRKGSVGQAHRRGVHNNDDDYGCNNIEERNDVDELEMGNGGERNKDKENREHGNNNNGKATGEHARHWLKILKNVSVPLPLCLVACCASFNLGSRISPSIFPYTYTGHMNKSLSESTQNKNKPAHRGLAINAEILHGINEFKQLFNKTDKTYRHGYLGCMADGYSNTNSRRILPFSRLGVKPVNPHRHGPSTLGPIHMLI